MLNSRTFAPQMFHHNDFLISTEPEKIDVDMVHHYLTHESYWAEGITREQVERSLRYSLSFGIYDCSGTDDAQIGFAE